MYQRHRYLLAVAFAAGLSACAGATQSSGGTNGASAASNAGAAGDSGAGVGGEAQTPIVVVVDQCDSGRLTACVETCGDTELADKAADCTNGRYECPEGMRPAASCPEGSWTGSAAGCGPWIKYYNCTFRALCDHGFWTCPPPAPNP